MYALYQQILLPTLSALCVMVLSWIMYVASRRLGKPAKGETFKEKLYIVQSIVAAFLLGQIAGHTTVFTSSFPLLYGYLFVLGGIVCLRHLESVAVHGARTCQTHRRSRAKYMILKWMPI